MSDFEKIVYDGMQATLDGDKEKASLAVARASVKTAVMLQIFCPVEWCKTILDQSSAALLTVNSSGETMAAVLCGSCKEQFLAKAQKFATDTNQEVLVETWDGALEFKPEEE